MFDVDVSDSDFVDTHVRSVLNLLEPLLVDIATRED